MKAMTVLAMLLMLSACMQQADVWSVLAKDKDYKDWLGDFQKGRARSFELGQQTVAELTDEFVKQKTAEWEKEQGTQPYTAIFENITAGKGRYYINAYDKTDAGRGFMAVVDVNEGKALKFFGLIKIEANVGGG